MPHFCIQDFIQEIELNHWHLLFVFCNLNDAIFKTLLSLRNNQQTLNHYLEFSPLMILEVLITYIIGTISDITFKI